MMKYTRVTATKYVCVNYMKTCLNWLDLVTERLKKK